MAIGTTVVSVLLFAGSDHLNPEGIKDVQRAMEAANCLKMNHVRMFLAKNETACLDTYLEAELENNKPMKNQQKQEAKLETT